MSRNMTNSKKTIEVKELAELMGTSLTVCYALCNQPDFPSFRIGRKILIDRERFDEWVEKQIDARRESVSKQA